MTARQKSVTHSPSKTRRAVIAGASLAVGGIALRSTAALAASDEEISHTAEAIHQEVILKASRARVYSALTDAKLFQQLVLLSGAVKSGMVNAAQTAKISGVPGGAFELFGGHIVGRLIELVPNERVVQAWRPTDWASGVYSIAKFELMDTGVGTKLVLDHTGFPKGRGEHLAAGWKANYWEPLAKFLA
jgi:activator of HSP90 ATPase